MLYELTEQSGNRGWKYNSGKEDAKLKQIALPVVT